MGKYRGVIALIFGSPPELEGNRKILKRAIERSTELGRVLTISAGKALKGLNDPHVLFAPPDKCKNTWRFCEWAAEVIKERGLENCDFLLEAEPDHATRCIRDFKWLGISVEEDNYFRAHNMHFYDPKSEQWRTRPENRSSFLRREKILMRLPKWFYKITAG